MRQHFYSHLVKTDILIAELGTLDLSEEERGRLVVILESSLHHAIMGAILSELKEEDKRTFLTHASSHNHEKIWEFLNQKIEHIEEKIRITAEELKNEMMKDVEEIKRGEEKS